MLCLLQANKENFEQGMTQCLVRCKAVSDSDQCNNVFGIVNSYFQWQFYEARNEDIITVNNLLYVG